MLSNFIAMFHLYALMHAYARALSARACAPGQVFTLCDYMMMIEIIMMQRGCGADGLMPPYGVARAMTFIEMKMRSPYALIIRCFAHFATRAS